jgi:hypothetical protein
MMARFRSGNEERENGCWMEGEERRCTMCYEERETIEHMWNGEETAREGTRKNTEWRRKGDKMDERDMDEEGKNRKRKWWGIEIKMYFFGIVIFMFMYNNCNQESESP